MSSLLIMIMVIHSPNRLLIMVCFPVSMKKQEYDAWVQQHEDVHAALECLDVDVCFDGEEES